MATIVEPSPSTLARTLASNRSRAVRADRLLDDDADPASGTNGATQTSGWLPKPAIRAPASTIAGVDDVRRDLDARDEIARRDDLAVERGEDLERVDPVEPLELRDPDVEDARRAAARRSTRLWFGPRTVEARARRRPSASRMRRLVLVELAGLGDEHA